MNHLDYVNTDTWYAWFPVQLDEGGWAWLTKVERTVDDRPEAYMGLLPQTSYTKIKECK